MRVIAAVFIFLATFSLILLPAVKTRSVGSQDSVELPKRIVTYSQHTIPVGEYRLIEILKAGRVTTYDLLDVKNGNEIKLNLPYNRYRKLDPLGSVIAVPVQGQVEFYPPKH
jgi:hypothetical protein